MTLAKGDHLAKVVPTSPNDSMQLVTGEMQHRFEVVECAMTANIYTGPTENPDYNNPANWQIGHNLVVLKVVD